MTIRLVAKLVASIGIEFVKLGNFEKLVRDSGTIGIVVMKLEATVTAVRCTGTLYQR